MKVQNNNRIDISKIYNENKPKASIDMQKVKKSYDSVEISKEGMEIAKYVNMSREMVDVRSQKVNEIKSKVQSGAYKVSTEELAKKILEAIDEGKNKP